MGEGGSADHIDDQQASGPSPERLSPVVMIYARPRSPTLVPSVGCVVGGLTGADYLVRPQHIQTYNLAFDRLRVASLGDRETLAIVDQLITELEE